jgi:hypothetical protein
MGTSTDDDNRFAGRIAHGIETPGKVSLLVLHHHAEAEKISRA